MEKTEEIREETYNNNEKSIKRTLRERNFIDSYIKGNGNATNAYLAISPNVTRESAAQLGKEMLKKVGLSVIELMDEMGMTDQAISAKLMDGMSATKSIGKGKDRKEVPDHTIISKYIDMAFKLKAMYPADKAKLELTGPHGEPLSQNQIYLIEKTYECPLRKRGECPKEAEIKELEKPKEAEKLKAMKEIENQKELDKIQEGKLEKGTGPKNYLEWKKGQKEI